MSYTVKRNLTTTIENDHYRVEFDGQEVCVFDKESSQRVVFLGLMNEALEIATLLYGIHTEVSKAKIVEEVQNGTDNQS